MIELIRNPDTPIYNLDISIGANTTKSDFSKFAQYNMYRKLRNEKVYTVVLNYDLEGEKIYEFTK